MKIKLLYFTVILFTFFYLFSTKNKVLAADIPISSCEELRDMSPLSGDFYLTQDIDCSDTSTWNGGAGWLPLGTFTGTFDGKEYTINGLFVNRPTTDYVGLFSEIAGGHVFNLSLTNIDITSQDYGGGLAGTITTSSTIEDITTSGSINGNSELGGIAGDAYGSSFENCISSANITGTYGEGTVAGLIGAIYDGTTITNCSASGDVSGARSAGGLVGDTYSTSSISNSHATGNISNASYTIGGLVGGSRSTVSNSWASGTVTINNTDCSYTGGLVGENYLTVSNSWASGTVTTVDNDNVGGLVGFSSGDGIVEKSYSTGGAVTSEGENIGGLVGLNSGIIRKSYSTKNVEGLSCIGGLVGVSSNGTISNCYSGGNIVVIGGLGGGFLGINSSSSVSYSYSTGTATGNGQILPFIGDGGPPSSNSFWDVDTSEIGSSGDNNLGAIGKTTSQMQTLTTFSESGWSISQGSNYSSASTWFLGDSYPKLYYIPGIETKTIDDDTITSTNATLQGELKYYYNVDVYFQYRKVGESWVNTSPQTKIDLGTFTQKISNLDSNTTYEFRAAVDYGSGINYGDTLSFSTLTAPTPTPTAVPTQTPITSSNNTPVFITNTFCSDPKPASTPDLFQINATNNSAKLFFTPINNTSNFYISFSENPEAQTHGEKIFLLKEGVQSHNIYYLKPNTVYYVKVRGQLGCMPGDWSNIMKFKTNSQIYYKNQTNNFTSTIKNIIKSTLSKFTQNKKTEKTTLDNKITPTPKNKITPTEEKETTTTQTPISETKKEKKCFLFWCW